MGRNFLIYTAATLIALFGTIISAARMHKGQYFGTVVHLTNLPYFGIILTNALLWSVVMFGKFVTRVFFGDLSMWERQRGVERFFICLTESIFEMAYLRFVGYSAMRLFACSLFLRVFHALGQFRHESIEQSAQPLAGKTARLTVLMLILFVIDIFSLYHFATVVAAEGFGIGMVFLLDYSLMAVSAIGTLVRVYINQSSKSGTGHSERFHATKFYLNVVLSVATSLLHVAFFCALFTYTIPFHLVRGLIVNLSDMATNCRRLINYRRLAANIDRVLSNATAEQIANNKECAICYEEMAEGPDCKALPCAHVFHRQCLLRWFEKQTACAYCGKDVKRLFERGGGVAVPAAAAAAPAAAVAEAGAAPLPHPQPEQPGVGVAVVATVPVDLAANADLHGLDDDALEAELQRLLAEMVAMDGRMDRGAPPPTVATEEAKTVTSVAASPAPPTLAVPSPTASSSAAASGSPPASSVSRDVFPSHAPLANSALSLNSGAAPTALPTAYHSMISSSANAHGGFPPIIPVDASSPSQSAGVPPMAPPSFAPLQPVTATTAAAARGGGGLAPPLVLSSDPLILSRQVAAYQKYVEQTRAASEELERALAALNFAAAPAQPSK